MLIQSTLTAGHVTPARFILTLHQFDDSNKSNRLETFNYTSQCHLMQGRADTAVP